MGEWTWRDTLLLWLEHPVDQLQKVIALRYLHRHRLFVTADMPDVKVGQ